MMRREVETWLRVGVLLGGIPVAVNGRKESLTLVDS